MKERETNVDFVGRSPDIGLFELMMGLLDNLKSYISTIADDYGISVPQAHMLWLLTPGQPVPMGFVADKMRCDPSNVTGIVDRLEITQLVERVAGTEDRRVKTLVLTDKGERIRDELTERIKSDFPMLKRLDAEESAQLAALLAKAQDISI